jgi:hypothetical protein
MDEPQFIIKNPFSARLTNEELQIFQESLLDIVPDIDPENLNNRILLNRLVELSVSKGKKVFLKDPESEAKIKENENLTNEIGRLKILIDQKDEQIRDLKSDLTTLQDKSLELAEELSKSTIDLASVKTKVPADSSIILELSPKQKTLIEETCTRLSQRLKQSIRPGKFLFHLFWIHYVKQESEPPFPFVIGRKDFIRTVASNAKSEQQAENE